MNERILEAVGGNPTDVTPVWFMRQAGRSLPEYREIRGEGSILDAIVKPELACEITLQPVRRYGVDAAILYSDIMVPAHAIGFGVEIQPGIGPVIESPFKNQADLKRLRNFEPDQDAPYVSETVRLTTKELDVPLIGFAGAPFTVASYLIEGQPTRTWAVTKSLMHSEPELWNALMERLTSIAIASIQGQLDAGASLFQLFDSWVGCLSRIEFESFVLPHVKRVFSEIGRAGIYFGTGTSHFLDLMGTSGAESIGVDWRLPINDAWKIANSKSIQGNLDPARCLSDWETVSRAVQEVLDSAGSRPGHVFNLGHGVLPETDPGIMTEVVNLVHESTGKK